MASQDRTESTIGKLFAQWLDAMEQWKAWSARQVEVYESYQQMKPAVPDILKLENAPARWAAALKGDCSPEPTLEATEYHRIPLFYLRGLASSGRHGAADAWLIAAIEEAVKYDAACETVYEASGLKASEEESGLLIDARVDLADRILACKASDIADVQMQVVVTTERHDGSQVGEYEEDLFASILSVPSSFNAEAANA